MAETVPCPKCERATPVRRAHCMYCGEVLPVTELSLDVQVPILRAVEEWERGYNVIVTSSPSPDSDHCADRLCEITSMDPDLASAIVRVGSPIPVARVATAKEADLVSRLLDAAGFGSRVISDESLGAEKVLKRARSLRLDGDQLGVQSLFGDWMTLNRSSLIVAVDGRLVSSRVDILEKGTSERKRELLETAEYFSEAFLIDVYGPTLEESFRIRGDGFDFSCLEGKPSPALESNVNRLSAELGAYLGAERLDTSFRSASKLLGHAWPTVSKSTSRGLARRGDLRRYAKSSVERDAMEQFTRYSRMHFALRRS